MLGEPEPARVSELDYSAPLNDAHQERDYGNHQQNVDETAHGV